MGEKKITKEEARVLRILKAQPAVEQEGNELRSVIGLCVSGLAAYGPWEDVTTRGVRYRSRTIRITPAGRAALKEASNG